MTPQTIMWLVNLGLTMPDLAMKVQRLFTVQNPTQADWDPVWETIKKTPDDYLREARARLQALTPPA